MNKRLSQLLEKATPEEVNEIEDFMSFIIAKHNLKRHRVLSDDISTNELTELVINSGSFNWLDNEEEDIYSIEDGAPVKW